MRQGMHDLFRKLAHTASEADGTTWAFILATGVIIVWAITGPIFGFSDAWQLVINMGTAILTFPMAFLIQNVQSHKAKVIHPKLDERISSIHGARNATINLDSVSDEELARHYG